MDLGAPVRPSSADTRPTRGHGVFLSQRLAEASPLSCFQPLGTIQERAKASQTSMLVPFLWCLSLWSLHNELACAINPVWLSGDLWLQGRLLGIGRIIIASSAFSMQEKRAGELRFVPPSEDLMCAACSKSRGKTFTLITLNRPDSCSKELILDPTENNNIKCLTWNLQCLHNNISYCCHLFLSLCYIIVWNMTILTAMLRH